MKEILIASALIFGVAFRSVGQEFINLDFERAKVVPIRNSETSLDWSLAAPGWSHSEGADTSIIYYRYPHAGLTQWYLLEDDNSPSGAPGTQLEGRYSLSFANGLSTGLGGTAVQAYISQTGRIPDDSHSIRFLGRGLFQVFIDGIIIPVQNIGNNVYVGDVSSFAGSTAELKIANASSYSFPVVVDNIMFSPAAAVPEPSGAALIGLGMISLLVYRWRDGRPCPLANPAGTSRLPWLRSRDLNR